MRSAVRVLVMGVMLSAVSWAEERTLTVCLAPTPEISYRLQSLGQGYASRVYQAIWVRLHWKSSCSAAVRNTPGTTRSPNLSAIGIEWALHAPASVSSAAYAAARPYQPTGTRITLYEDRLMPVMQEPTLAAAVLGHVLAHEIGHVLLGHTGHAEDGLMKANWSAAEQTGMAYRLMRFNTEEAESIRGTLDQRATVLTAKR